MRWAITFGYTILIVYSSYVVSDAVVSGIHCKLYA